MNYHGLKTINVRLFGKTLVAALTLSLFGSLPAAVAEIILPAIKDSQLARCKGSGYDTNYGALANLRVRSADGNWSTKPEPKIVRSVLQFDFGEITRPIVKAELGLYYYQKWSADNPADPPAGRIYEIRRLLRAWDEGAGKSTKQVGGPNYSTEGVSWKNSLNSGSPTRWQCANYTHIDDSGTLPAGYVDPPGWYPQDSFGGGDFPYTDYDGSDHWGGDEVCATVEMPDCYGWVTWDITGLACDWQDGTVENYGVILKDQNELWHRPAVYDEIYGSISDGNWHGWGAFFRSKEYAEDPSQQPRLVITTAVPGDANADGFVNGLDAAQLAACWLQTGNATWADGDFNRDGNVDARDATLLAANWHPAAEQTRVTVPEPSTAILLAVGTAMVLARGKRRRRASRRSCL